MIATPGWATPEFRARLNRAMEQHAVAELPLGSQSHFEIVTPDPAREQLRTEMHAKMSELFDLSSAYLDDILGAIAPFVDELHARAHYLGAIAAMMSRNVQTLTADLATANCTNRNLDQLLAARETQVADLGQDIAKWQRIHEVTQQGLVAMERSRDSWKAALGVDHRDIDTTPEEAAAGVRGTATQPAPEPREHTGGEWALRYLNSGTIQTFPDRDEAEAYLMPGKSEIVYRHVGRWAALEPAPSPEEKQATGEAFLAELGRVGDEVGARSLRENPQPPHEYTEHVDQDGHRGGYCGFCGYGEHGFIPLGTRVTAFAGPTFGYITGTLVADEHINGQGWAAIRTVGAAMPYAVMTESLELAEGGVL